MFAERTRPPWRARAGVAAVVLLLHAAVIVALVQAFAPRLGSAVVARAVSAFDVPLEPAPPEPSPTPSPKAPSPAVAPEPEGAAAPEGRKATPREVSAPKADLRLSELVAPPVAGTGNADSAGAAEQGTGTGAGGLGQGTGSGTAGSGTGGGGASKAVKIAGDINSARDYPKASRELRLGSAVTLALTVNTAGRVAGCKVLRPSRDPEADRITCRLATERFRFRPATDAQGNPVVSVFGWQQRWFTPPRN